MFNNKFWFIIAITLFSVLCCLGSQEEVKVNKDRLAESSNLLTAEDILTKEDDTCPWDETTVFHRYRTNVDYKIPCSIYDEAVKQGKKEYATLMVAISIWETGWYQSPAFINKRNFGGMYDNGSLMYFENYEAGAKEYVNMLSKYYIDQGLDDAYKMQSKYAGGSTTWANNVLTVQKIIEEAKRS